MTLAALKSPYISSNSASDAIKYMSAATGGDRYFVFGIIALNIVFAKATYSVIKKKALYYFILVFFGMGFLSSLRYQSFFIQKNFIDFTAEYKAGSDKLSKSGVREDIIIPVNPGHGWIIRLSEQNKDNPNYN